MSSGLKHARLVRLFAWTAAVAVMILTGLEFRKKSGGKTIDQQLARYGAAVEQRLIPVFALRKVPYPPTSLALIGFKKERVLEVWATGKGNDYVFIKAYPIMAASGSLGPKLREGDGQVPEGIYRVESLNPNSHYHLSLRLSYPNDLDRLNARRDGRRNLGGDIMIHGGAASIGCLAMEDEATEDLFVLAARTGIAKIVVILSPVDFGRGDLPGPTPQLAWVETLYADIKEALKAFPKLSVSES